MMNRLNFRIAGIDDLPAIVSIYNSTIDSRMVTADTEPVTVESRIDWFYKHSENRPLWMADNGKEVVGWAGFQSFYGRPAYDATVEVSIYIAETQRGKGYGKEILEYCLQQCPTFGVKTLLGFIFAHNVPSLQLFDKYGFSQWGLFPNIALLDGVERSLVIVGKRVVD